MKLTDLIHNKKEPTEDRPVVAKIVTLAVAITQNEKTNHDAIEEIRAWLHRIGEPSEDHNLVLNKCKSDPDAMEYHLRHARGEGSPKERNTPQSKDIEETRQEQRRPKVLAMLDDQPDTERAVVTDASTDPNNVILTIAIRNQYIFEMQISKVKYDGLALFSIIHGLKEAGTNH